MLSEQMKAQALEGQKVARKHLVVSLDFSVESLEGLDAACDDVDFALRGGKSEENLRMLAATWGAYLGEVLCREGGGAWLEDAEGPAVEMPSGFRVRPQRLVRARLGDPPHGGSLPEAYRAAVARS